jgi:glycosyltransferase involved in cell wall biosynthesis
MGHQLQICQDHMTIALVSRMDEREVRSEKILQSLVKRGYHCMFVGWNRFAEEWQPSQARWERQIWQQPAGMGVGTAEHFFRFREFVVNALRKHPVRLVIGVNEETVYLLKNWRGRLFSALLLDAHDELDTRVRTANPLLQGMLCYVASQARAAADAIFCAHLRRRDCYRPTHQRKTVILPNYPADFGAHLWSHIPEGEFRIFAGGALGRERGLEFLLQAAELARIRIVAAGRLMDDYARDIFSRHPLVHYVGCLTPQGAMAQLADCHASVAFYAPGPKINRLAAPNKIYDALCVGRPILVSDETEVADWVEKNATGFRIKYGDVEGLVARIERLRTNQSELPSFAVRARELFLQGYSWESQEPVLYSVVESALGHRAMWTALAEKN